MKRGSHKSTVPFIDTALSTFGLCLSFKSSCILSYAHVKYAQYEIHIKGYIHIEVIGKVFWYENKIWTAAVPGVCLAWAFTCCTNIVAFTGPSGNDRMSPFMNFHVLIDGNIHDKK